MKTLSILSTPVHDVTYAETLDLFSDYVKDGGVHQICTVNPEFVMTAQRAPEFMHVLHNADLCLPDGQGLLWAAKLKGTQLRERVAGSTLMYKIAERAAEEGWRVFLLGAAEGVANKTAKILEEKHPDLKIVGTWSGSPSAEDSPGIVQLIIQSRVDVLLVAYGAPKQDLWIYKYGNELKVPVMMGVGGSFDFVAGVAKRAPEWAQNMGIEWLHRLVMEPWRWKRMLALPKFALRVIFGKDSVKVQ